MKKIIHLKESPGKITNSDTLFAKIKKIDIDYNQENFLTFFLDARLNLIDTEILFKGGINTCMIDPRTIFRRALLKNSCAVVVAHNHPSGELSPSEDDINVFEELKKGGELIQIEVLDSIIFNKTQFFTMKNFT